MAKLTSKERKRLKGSSFAGPDRSYPVEDKAHAVNAKSRAKQQFDRGKLSLAEYHTIVSKANRKLHGKT